MDSHIQGIVRWLCSVERSIKSTTTCNSDDAQYVWSAVERVKASAHTLLVVKLRSFKLTAR